MLISALTIDNGSVLECDVCVVGAGAAGLVVAHELAGSGLEVVVIAGGGPKRERFSQGLYKGAVLDTQRHSWLHESRVRGYGGTTAIWRGRCLPYDPIDHERRDYVPHSGWAFGADALQPFYLRAASYCEIGQPVFDAAQALPDQPAALVPGLAEDTVISTVLERNSRPTDFGRLLRRALQAAPRVRLLLDAHCIGLRGEPGGTGVGDASCATVRPSRFAVRARHYVVAAGGLESTRLLLASRDAADHPLRLPSPWLGRGYMCHLTGTIGTVRFNVPADSIQHGHHRTVDGVYCRRHFWVAPHEQRRRRMLNIIFRLHHPPVDDPAHRHPVLSAMHLVKRVTASNRTARDGRDQRSWRRLLGHARNIAGHPVELSRFAAGWVRQRNLSARPVPSVVLFSPSASYAIEYQSEQAPDPDSTVTLGPERDGFGMPHIVVDWRCSELDTETVRQGYAALRAAFERDGVGTLELDKERFDAQLRRDRAIDGHHIGTLRMADSVRDGVTDWDGRVFGVPNCSVASAAVMPTSSTANPTFTTVALAIRLADRLRAELVRAGRQ